MIETSDGIVSPTQDDEYSLVQDLAAMAQSVQQVIDKRANARFGTQSEREAFQVDAPEGTLWKDTTGERILWVKHGSSWERLWPAAVSRSLIVGSFEQISSFPFMNLRWLQDNGDNSNIIIRQSPSVEKVGLSVINRVNNSDTSSFSFRHDGQILHSYGGVSRSIPFAVYSGRTLVTHEDLDSHVNSAVSLPQGYFTQSPNIQLTAESEYPERINLSVKNVSRNGFSIRSYRPTRAEFWVHWTAQQQFNSRPG